MKVYIYDSETKEFKNEYSPQKNPKKVGEYLLPRFSTIIKPEEKEGFIPVFDGSKWVLEPDFRGKEVIYLESGIIETYKKIGELPQGVILLDEYKASDEYVQKMNLQEKEKQIQEIKAQIDALDLKRIRAISEPEEKSDGVTWLEFYTQQIVELRQKLQEL